MVQIVNSPGLAALTGQSLGTGIGGALQQLANWKTNEILQAKQSAQRESALKALFEPEQAKALSTLPEELLKPLITEKAKASNRLAQTGPGIQTIAPELTPEQSSKIGQLPPGVQQLWYRNYLQSPQQALESINQAPTTFTPKAINDFAKKNTVELKKPQQPEVPQPDKPIIKPVAEVEKTKSLRGQPAQPGVEKQEVVVIPKPKNTSEYMREGYTKDEAKELAKADIKRSLLEEKESQQVINDVFKQQKAAKENNLTLAKMEKLINKGNLPNPALYKFIKDIEEKVTPTTGAAVGGTLGGFFGGPLGKLGGAAAGATIGGLISPVAGLIESGIKYKYPDTEQFEKLSNSFIRNAKEIFGARVTDLDLKAFLTTVPTLTQTEQGKRQIIENLRIFNNAAEVRGKVLKDILKETKGRKPENLALLIEERSDKELDKLSQEFLENVPEAVQIRDTAPVQWPWQQILGENITV